MYRDTEMSEWIYENISSKSTAIGKVAKFLSNICEFGALWIVIMIALVVYKLIKTKKFDFYYVIVLPVVLLGWMFCELFLKVKIGRTRPFQNIEAFKLYMDSIKYTYPHGCSFPSGHSMVAFAAAFAIARRFKKLAIPAYVLAALIACSRLVLGAHYVSDVIAGIGFGTFFSVIGCVLADYFTPKIDLALENKKKAKEAK